MGSGKNEIGMSCGTFRVTDQGRNGTYIKRNCGYRFKGVEMGARFFGADEKEF